MQWFTGNRAHSITSYSAPGGVVKEPLEARLVAGLEKGCGAGPGWGSGTSITSIFLDPCDRSSPAIGRLVGLLAGTLVSTVLVQP